MSEPYIGEVRTFGFTFAPKNWAFCNGQLLAISQNTALFSIIGTYYGGNGTSNFALPNLQGKAPLGMGTGAGLSNYVIGQTGGEQTHTLTASEIPPHNHTMAASSQPGEDTSPTGEALASSSGPKLYQNVTNTNLVTLNAATLNTVGSSGSHNNMMPYLTINFCICTAGVFPARN